MALRSLTQRAWAPICVALACLYVGCATGPAQSGASGLASAAPVSSGDYCEVGATYDEDQAYPRRIDAASLCEGDARAALETLVALLHAIELGVNREQVGALFAPDASGITFGRADRAGDYDRALRPADLTRWLGHWDALLADPELDLPETALKSARVRVMDNGERASIDANYYLLWGFGEDSLEAQVRVTLVRSGERFLVAGARQWTVSFAGVDEFEPYDSDYWARLDAEVDASQTALEQSAPDARVEALAEHLRACLWARRYASALSSARELANADGASAEELELAAQALFHSLHFDEAAALRHRAQELTEQELTEQQTP